MHICIIFNIFTGSAVVHCTIYRSRRQMTVVHFCSVQFSYCDVSDALECCCARQFSLYL